MVVLWNACEGIRTEAFGAGIIGELILALREMLEYAEAINTDKRARTVNLKFSSLTLEMWMEKARTALSEAETSVLPTEPELPLRRPALRTKKDTGWNTATLPNRLASVAAAATIRLSDPPI